MIIDIPSQMHPKIRTFLLPLVKSRFANTGAKIAIDIEYEEKTSPKRDDGTPFLIASPG